MLFSIVVAVGKATITLDRLVQRISLVMARLPQLVFEAVFVDDSSVRPETRPTAKLIASEQDQAIAVLPMRNFGQTGHAQRCPRGAEPFMSADVLWARGRPDARKCSPALRATAACRRRARFRSPL